jgi:nucleoside-diphosphate-sugar epimerase
MKVLVIGATGHVGTYLVPRLVNAGYDVVSMSRGQREPYRPDPAWSKVDKIEIDRIAEDKKGAFGEAVARVGADVIIDLILFHPDSVPQLRDSLSGRIKQFVYCGTMWVYGPTQLAPTTEDDPRAADDTYGREKAEIERIFSDAAREGAFPACTLHPGHIVGPGWPPINPAGNVNLEVWEKLGRGEEVALPNDGLAMLHHVHADDVALGIQLAVQQPEKSLGESFNLVSPQSVTLRAFSRQVASWFGREAKLVYREWSEWKKHETGDDIEATWEHIRNSPCGSIAKARRVLGYEPAYTTYAMIREALAWLIENGRVVLPPLKQA